METPTLLSIQQYKQKRLLISNTDALFYLDIPQILYAKNDNSYTVFHRQGADSICVAHPLRAFEQILLKVDFVRANQSFMINMAHIEKIKKTDLGLVVCMSDDKEINIARSQKANFIKTLKQNAFSLIQQNGEENHPTSRRLLPNSRMKNNHSHN